MRFTDGRKSGTFLMAQMAPFDGALLSERIGKSVQGVTDNAIDPLYTHFMQSCRHVRCCSCHRNLLG
jgi:hypothetical protein